MGGLGFRGLGLGFRVWWLGLIVWVMGGGLGLGVRVLGGFRGYKG